MNDTEITRLLASRRKILTRRDGLIDSKRIARIDAKLRTVPPGTRNDVDIALGRLNAVLPERPQYQRNAQRSAPAEWFVNPAVTLEDMKRISADAMRDEKPIEY